MKEKKDGKQQVRVCMWSKKRSESVYIGRAATIQEANQLLIDSGYYELVVDRECRFYFGDKRIV